MNEESPGGIAGRIRRDIVEMLYRCQSGHPGGSLSCVEILMALYYRTMRINPANPAWNERDRFVMSKGHGCPTLYAILADLGFFPCEDLWNLRQIGSHLQGHPDMMKTPGIDANTGSLGQGASIAVGMALAAKCKKESHNVFALLGDGEVQEGLVWEAAMSASHYRLDNLVFLLDHNGLQIDGKNEEVMGLGDIEKKFAAFGFEYLTVDGHDVAAIAAALAAPSKGKPKFIRCVTVKGKGVSFMENNAGWHGKPLSADDYKTAMRELGGTVNA